MFIVSDNTSTKVTCKMLSSDAKAVRHTCNCIVQSLEIYIHLFGCSCKGKGLHKLPIYSIMYICIRSEVLLFSKLCRHIRLIPSNEYIYIRILLYYYHYCAKPLYRVYMHITNDYLCTLIAK